MIENLTTEQKDRALRFLLHHMTSTTRIAFMAEMPVAYARLYTSCDSAAIMTRVREGIGR